MVERFPTVTIDKFQENPFDVYEMVAEHPVVILNDHEPKLVCFKPEEWNKIDQLIEDQEDMIATLKAELEVALGQDEMIEITNFDAFRADILSTEPDSDIAPVNSTKPEGVSNLVPA